MSPHAHSSHEHSFLVHMQSLGDFTRELETQLDGLIKPSDDLANIAGQPLLLGDFGEAHGLARSHNATISQMCDLLGQVKQAIAFADEVTQVVAGHYVQADHDVAAALGLGG